MIPGVDNNNNLAQGRFGKYLHSDLFVFSLLWVISFVLYLPTAQAGFVGDLPGWQSQVSDLGFWEYMNRTRSGIQGLYQFTQFNTNLIHGIFGTHAWLWFLLDISLQACNGFLLFILCRQLFVDSGIKNAFSIAIWGVVFFAVSPHITEVVVWKAAFHYLQGLLMMLFILRLMQKYQHQQKLKYAIAAAIIFFLSTYTLEYFYLTPFMGLAIALYYRFALLCNKSVFKKTLLVFFLPQLLLFAAYFLVLKMIYGFTIPHLGNGPAAPLITYLSKPAKYVFHILLYGRFFPYDVRLQVYKYCDSLPCVILSIGIIVLVSTYIIIRFKRLTGKGKAAGILLAWSLLTLAIVAPMWFPDIFLVIYDRYTYFMDGFIMMLVALLISAIPNKKLRVAIYLLYAIVNITFTIKLTNYWKESAHIVSNLLSHFPKSDKITIILSMPECLEGVQMIGTKEESEFKHLYDLLQPKPITNKVYDALSFNMTSAHDGTHVKVLGDSILQVTLNQWGTWWWYEGFGAHSYENEDYKLDLKDPGHMYELTLKKPSAQYLLLYQQGDEWKIVNWTLKNTEQY